MCILTHTLSYLLQRLTPCQVLLQCYCYWGYELVSPIPARVLYSVSDFLLCTTIDKGVLIRPRFPLADGLKHHRLTVVSSPWRRMQKLSANSKADQLWPTMHAIFLLWCPGSAYFFAWEALPSPKWLIILLFFNLNPSSSLSSECINWAPAEFQGID